MGGFVRVMVMAARWE